ncbi:YbbR domain-containing protein [Caldicoprobacter guelmensis]|uniref:CdaR family protein n=1 Tax=Caldicoprobacter guelmensis TaxID=1170224 RepID=UPI00195D8AB4|nr:CdaR family protein [Caldicoprobacter guelmensis]MBM7581594.1 YbbR domain-containing protein [Caldicoprobacter guelmensis]
MHSKLGKNFALKLISVIIAIILWLIAIREQNPEVTRNYDSVPVKIVNEDKFKEKGLTLVYDIPSGVNISVRGRVRDLERINAEQLQGVLDLSEVNEPGEYRLLIDIKGLPSGVTLRRKPDVIVKADYLVYKDVVITTDIDIKEAKGYLAFSHSMKPTNTVKVTGPESLIKRIYRAMVSLKLSEVSSTVEYSLPVLLMDEEGRTIESKYININPRYVTVVVPVYPTKVLPIKPNIAGVPNDNYEIVSVEVYPQEVTVSGEKSILDKIDSISTQVLDIEGATADVKQTLKLQKYEGITIAPSNPNEVEVIVRIREKDIQRSLTVDNIQIINTPEGSEVELEPTSAEIVISGPATVINSVDENSVRAYVDLANISRGEHRLKVMVDIPSGTHLVEVRPAEVTVNVK